MNTRRLALALFCAASLAGCAGHPTTPTAADSGPAFDQAQDTTTHGTTQADSTSGGTERNAGGGMFGSGT